MYIYIYIYSSVIKEEYRDTYSCTHVSTLSIDGRSSSKTWPPTLEGFRQGLLPDLLFCGHGLFRSSNSRTPKTA